MSSIMRRRRGLKSAISILLSEGVGSNTHILSARRRTTPPCPLRRGSGFVQSQTSICKKNVPRAAIAGKSNPGNSRNFYCRSIASGFFTVDESRPVESGPVESGPVESGPVESGPGGAAGRIVGPVAVESDDTPFDRVAVAGKAAILDEREVHLAHLAVVEQGVTRSIAARNVVGLPRPECDLVNGGEAGDLQRGIPERAFLFPELG